MTTTAKNNPAATITTYSAALIADALDDINDEFHSSGDLNEDQTLVAGSDFVDGLIADWIKANA